LLNAAQICRDEKCLADRRPERKTALTSTSAALDIFLDVGNLPGNAGVVGWEPAEGDQGADGDLVVAG
jgi:hypothetical protein